MEAQEIPPKPEPYIKIAQSAQIPDWHTPEKRTHASTKLPSSYAKSQQIYSASSAGHTAEQSDALRSPQRQQASSKSRWSLISSEQGKAFLLSSRGQSPSLDPYSVKRLIIRSPNQSDNSSAVQERKKAVTRLKHQTTSPQKQNKPSIFQLTGTLLEETNNQIQIPKSLPADSFHYFSSDPGQLDRTISQFCYDENDSLLQTPEVLECHTVKRERPQVFQEEFQSPMLLDEEEEEGGEDLLPRFIDPRMYECETIRQGTEELNLTTEFNKAMHLRSELGTFQLTSNIMMSIKRGGREVESVKNLEIKNSSLEDSNGKVFKMPHS